MGDAALDPESVTSGGDEPATAHALPPPAHARRAAAAAIPTTPAPAPDVSQQLAITTLREEGADTARQMIRVGRYLGLAAALTLPFSPGHTGLKTALAAAIVHVVIVGLVVERRISVPGRFNERTMVTLAFSVGPAILIAVAYFGVLSAVQLAPSLALYFFSRRERLLRARPLPRQRDRAGPGSRR